ncbi:MAG: 50S ribosomal protein L9 [Candidatus Margulisbacteria bacterium]|nr:50S ribosomal protein L9 [Candidatus Margulisiibacteriota bacterium]
MKIILKKAVPSVGDEDSLIEVSEGYARNFLFPRKLAGPATPVAVAAWETRRVEREKKSAARKAEQEELANKLSSLELTIGVDAGEGGKLFGSVTSQDIATEVTKVAGIEIDKKKIELSEPLKAIGDYSVSIKLFQDITAKLKVKLVSK